MKRNYFIALAILGFLLLEAVLIAFVDRPLSEYLHAVDAAHPWFINIFRAYTDLGESKWYLWPTIIGAIICAILVRQKSLPQAARDRLGRIGAALSFIFITVAVSGIVTDILKPIIGRARPAVLARQEIYGAHPLTFSSIWNSMPSGHATTAFALAFSLMVFFPRGRIVFLTLACVLAVSRVMVNAHFASDVVAGAAVGAVTVTFLRQVLAPNGIFLLRKYFSH